MTLTAPAPPQAQSLRLAAPSRRPARPGTGSGSGSRLGYALGFTLAVLVADQLSKAWAWRHLRDVRVNVGGDRYSGAVLDSLLQGRFSGALLDVVDAALLIAIGFVLTRWTRGLTFVGGVAALAGWASNIGDRLGLHFLTAPGSARGAVDFIHLDGAYWNVADAMILAGTALFVIGLAMAPLRLLRPRLSQHLPRSGGSRVAPTGPRPRNPRRTVRVLAATLGVLVVLATIGVFAGDAVRPSVDSAAGLH